MIASVALFLAVLLALCAVEAPAQTIANHKLQYDGAGTLLPWAPWEDTIDREMRWYLACPIQNGYPRFIWMTFMDGNYQPIPRRVDFIPAMQNGMGIISYLKYYEFKDRKNPKVLEFARSMGDYLVKESLTPNRGRWPRFTRSTGHRARFPQPPDGGSQGDRPYEIEPDKGGIAGYALAVLFEATKDQRYLDQALQNARVLVTNMGRGTRLKSPWPFRIDYRTGEERGEASGNMSFILRLFDKLIERGYSEFQEPRGALWTWIKNEQIPSAAKDGLLWTHFFEDHQEADNRTAWAPLNLARYLVEKKTALDPDWKEDARTLIDFVNHRFVSVRFGVAVCGEQDYDRNPWGGILSTWAAVLAMYSAAAETREDRALARQAMSLCLYAVEEDGCPHDSVLKRERGGWQEDAHTDKIHNVIDAILAFRAMK